MSDADAFFARGWVRVPWDPVLAAWVEEAAPVALALAADAGERERWLRCGGTWYAGVNAFPNDARGGVPAQGVPPLDGAAVAFVRDTLLLDTFDWDPGQISVCYPGYPQPSEAETPAAFRFRRDRDAAHVDGFERTLDRRRTPNETHGFILGIPLNDTPQGAAPFVVYDGSHAIFRQAMVERLKDIPPEDWRTEDVTEAYNAARRTVFETCKRIEIEARPGEAYLAHRLCLHGVAPWTATAEGCRAVAYFRPDPFPGARMDWWLSRS